MLASLTFALIQEGSFSRSASLIPSCFMNTSKRYSLFCHLYDGLSSIASIPFILYLFFCCYFFLVRHLALVYVP
jgi:hypothetical protein